MVVEATRGLLARMIEDSALLTQVRGLDARTLGRVVRHIGLEDAGEIVALATTDQLRDMFDDDLWVAPEPGTEEKFDGPRFALWLEILLESGEQFVADKLTELPEELVTLGFQKQVFVVDIDALAMEMSGRTCVVDLVEKALESCLYEEIDRFRVIARRHEHWDAIITTLLALDRYHHAFLQRLLERCCDASTGYIEDNGGLYDVLTSEEVIEADAAADREDRRATAGFVSASDAAAFFGLPRVHTLEEVVAKQERDPIASAYFRSIAPQEHRVAATPQVRDLDQERLVALLEDAGVVEPTGLSLPARRSSGKSKHVPSFQRALEALREDEPEVYAKRTSELAFLANVLVVGSSFAGRSFRPVEAAEAAISTCNIGMDLLVASSNARASDAAREHSADHLFRVGWHVLFHEVSMCAAQALVRKLAAMGASAKLISAVHAAIDDQKPWQARPKVLLKSTPLEPAEREVFSHLLDRFPTLPPKEPAQSTQSSKGTSKPPQFFARLADIDVANLLLQGG